jgi:malate/lactate dehydrogenase
VRPSQVKNVPIWGNHSATQYPDVSHGLIDATPIKDIITDTDWLQNDFVSIVQQRGTAVVNARKVGSAASASHAIVDHMRDWVFGTAPGEWVSMAVVSDGSYNVPKGLVFSFPVTIANGQYTIVPGLTIDEFSQLKLDATTAELVAEKDVAFSLLGL